MKKFIKSLLYFALPFILLACFFEMYLRQIATTYSEKEKGMIQDAKKIELLILGNSRPTFGIDSNVFDTYAFNLANVAQPIYYDKRITLKHLENLVHLKYVFIVLDATSFDYSRLGSREIWSYYGNGVTYKHPIPLAAKMSYIKGYSPSIALQMLKNNLSGKYKTIKALDAAADFKLDKPIVKGFFTYSGTREEGMSERYIFNRANKGTDRGVYPEHDEILNDLEDFIKTLQQKKITPILLTMPCYEDYVKTLNANVVKRSEADFEKLARKFNLEYWNYFSLPMERDHFHDCDHLNYKGAEKFSKILNLRLNEKIAKDNTNH